MTAICLRPASATATSSARLLVLAAGGAMLIVMSRPYRMQRLLAFLDPWKDPLGAGFQLIQSLIAVGSGGAFGKGLMAGVQKLFYIPEPHTDFIFAVDRRGARPDRHDGRS